MSVFSRQSLLVASLVIGSFSAAGCGGKPTVPTAEVEGVLTLDGKPIKESVRLVLFSKTTGQAPSSIVNEAGTFQFVESIQPGDYVVVLAPAAVEAPAGSGPPPTINRTIPDKFRSETTSPHPVTVQAGANKLTIDLKS